MIKLLSKIFRYIAPLWEGPDGKISLKRACAIYFALIVGQGTIYGVLHYKESPNLSDLVMLLGIPAGIFAALMGLSSWVNLAERKLNQKPPDTL